MFLLLLTIEVKIMARIPRVKIEGGGAYYHLCARTAGIKGEFPLDNQRSRRKIIEFV